MREHRAHSSRVCPRPSPVASPSAEDLLAELDSGPEKRFDGCAPHGIFDPDQREILGVSRPLRYLRRSCSRRARVSAFRSTARAVVTFESFSSICLSARTTDSSAVARAARASRSRSSIGSRAIHRCSGVARPGHLGVRLLVRSPAARVRAPSRNQRPDPCIAYPIGSVERLEELRPVRPDVASAEIPEAREDPIEVLVELVKVRVFAVEHGFALATVEWNLRSRKQLDGLS